MPRVKDTFPRAVGSPALSYTNLPTTTDSLTVKTIISVSFMVLKPLTVRQFKNKAYTKVRTFRHVC
jgi:hypothetical protein